MNWLQKCGVWLACRGAGRQTGKAEGDWPPEKADFVRQYPAVLSICRRLSGQVSLPPQRLALRYMASILEQEEEEENWWRENGVYLTQPWFIYEFCRRQHLLSAAALPPRPPLMILRPPGKENAPILFLRLERALHTPREGALFLEGPLEKEQEEMLREAGFQEKEGQWRREIDECAGPILDRGAEIGARLLEAGAALEIGEERLKEKILAHDFETEHRYWVIASPQENELLLRYPYDLSLNRYVRLAGGRWNGREMCFPIRAANRLEEIIQLYPFRCTQAAQQRLDAWQRALAQATIYRQRPWKQRYPTAAPEDMFHSLLKSERPVLDDLIDCDE